MCPRTQSGESVSEGHIMCEDMVFIWKKNSERSKNVKMAQMGKIALFARHECIYRAFIIFSKLTWYFQKKIKSIVWLSAQIGNKSTQNAISNVKIFAPHLITPNGEPKLLQFQISKIQIITWIKMNKNLINRYI